MFVAVLMVAIIFSLGALGARAATPTLTVYAVGGGDQVQVTVNGDASSSVWMYFQKTGYGSQSQYLGTTNNFGYFSTMVSTSNYGISNSSPVYVTVNGQQSASVNWPYGNGGGSFSLSQTNVNLTVGQSTTVTAYNSTSLYLSNNSNTSIVSVSISGSQIYLNALSNGSSSVVVCQSNYSSNCSTIYVIVQYGSGNYNNGNLSLSQNSVSLGVGQTATITISGGYAPYTMSANTNNIFRSVIGGNTLTIIAVNNGTDTLSVCSSGNTNCSSISISVNGYNNNYNNNYGQLSLSQNNLSLNSGGSGSVTIYGNGSYYVNSNSNSGIASANVSGNTLNVYAYSYGSTNISVCQTYGQCATLYVTVGYGNNNNNSVSAITFSQSNVSLSIGQSMTISVYGGSGSNYFIAYNSNSSGVQASLSGSSLYLNGLANSANAIVVCSATASCGAVTVTVGNTTNNNYNYNQGNWTYCAGENQWCSFSGTQNVRYGVNGSYYYRTLTGGVSCSNATFGDPAFGRVKQCYYGGTI